MTRPRIGITTAGKDRDGKLRVSARYVDAVRRAGGLPLLLPPEEHDVPEVLAACDGLVLTGGGDVAPRRYGGRDHPAVYDVDARRDESEIALVRALFAARKPALCICRGAQVLAVACGGTLVEHVPDEFGERVLHRGRGAYLEHRVTLEAGSRLARTLGIDALTVPSWHHQAVREPGAGLRVVARADDGVVEALEHESHDRLWAVQWHPEHSAATDPLQQRLFDALVAAAR
jgi:putative glutamine amidotransferase